MEPYSTSMSNYPPSGSGRTIVLCFDGTSESYDNTNSNVVKLFAMLQKDNHDEQLCYYQSGVGTYENPGIITPLLMMLTKYLDEGIAFYLNAHVMGGYNFLMDHYRPGDKICLFGFSRGAYTARALAGFITKIGLLPRGNIEQVAFAYRLFEKTGKKNDELAEGFKNQFCLPVQIEFLGVWDTVASTGIITSKNLPFTTDNNHIKTFRHALALDERRVRFEPTFYHTAPPPWNQNSIFSKLFRLSSNRNGKQRDEQPTVEYDIKEVWFVGDHCDVGGGWVSNDTRYCVANVPLKWMIREVVESGCGIRFNDGILKTFGIDRSLPLAQYFGLEAVFSDDGANEYKHRTDVEGSALPTTDTRDDLDGSAIDILQQTHDTLWSNPLWWVLEVFPNMLTWQDAAGDWQRRVEFHFGRGRHVSEQQQLYFHESVRTREILCGYKPRAKFSTSNVRYVW